jgi:hypothetical protein
VKDWQRKFESLFRPGGKGEGGALFITVLLLILALWLFSGFFQIKGLAAGTGRAALLIVCDVIGAATRRSSTATC